MSADKRPRPGGVDPRFDPAFQRGYRPAVERGGAEHGTAAERAAASAARHRDEMTQRPSQPVAGTPDIPVVAARVREIIDAPRSTPPRRSEVVGERPAPAVIPRAERVAPGVAPTEAASSVAPSAPPTPLSAPLTPLSATWIGDDDEADPEPVASERNGYFIALWVIGIAFVVIGVVAYLGSAFASYSPSGQSGSTFLLVLNQLGWTLSAPLITVGLATIVGLLFVRARGAERARVRRRPVEAWVQADEEQL